MRAVTGGDGHPAAGPLMLARRPVSTKRQRAAPLGAKRSMASRRPWVVTRGQVCDPLLSLNSGATCEAARSLVTRALSRASVCVHGALTAQRATGAGGRQRIASVYAVGAT